MTRLLRTTACALVSSLLLLLPAADATHHSKANAGVADIDDKHGGKLRHKNFRVREVRFSPFIVHNSTELNRALAVLEHESQKCNDFGRRRRRKDKHDGFDILGDVTDKRSGLRARGADISDNKHDDHKHKFVDEDEERCFGRILLAKGKKFQLEREFIFADAFKLDLEGRPGATIRAAPGMRHLTFDDQAVLSAHQVAFVDGGCDKEGFVGGSILVVNRASVITRGVNWTNNHAWSGGAIFADDAKRVNVFHAIFKDNSADRKGGAVAIREARQDRVRKGKHGKHDVDDTVGAASVRNRNNKNKNAANAAAIRRREAEERRRKKQQELAAARNKNKNGGALVTTTADDKHGKKQRVARKRRGTKAKFIRVKFVLNSANKGGALSNSGSHTEVEDCFFAKDKAHVGGAIFNNKRGRLLVRETAFVRNKASAKGGAVFNDGWLWIVCSAFVDNEAPLGADIFNNGWLKCTSDTIPVHIDGKGSGYCTPCAPPQTPAPTVRSTPTRKVKKKAVIENKENKHGDSDNKGRGGLFGGVFGNNNKNKRGDDKVDDAQAETVVFYDYYRHGEGNAYDRWNGYDSALVDEEDFDDFKTGYGYGSYEVGGAFDLKGDFEDKKFDDKDKFKGKKLDDSYYGKEDYGYGDDEYYGEDEGYYGKESAEDDYFGGEEEGAYGYGGSDNYY